MARTPVATDDFNRASLGANWSDLGDSPMVTSTSTVYCASHFSNAIGGTRGVARWNGAGTFSDDQYAKAAVAALTDQGLGSGTGVAVRVSADTNPNEDFYYALVNADSGNGGTHTVTVGKLLNGSNTSIGTRSTTFSNGDTIELEAEGTTLRVFKNGSQLGADFTDSSIASGKPGIINLSNSGAGNHGDDWEGGDVTGVVNASPSATGAESAAAAGGVQVIPAPPPPYTITRVTG